MPGSELPELFPGFERHEVDVDGLTLFCRRAGDGSPLLLLHGYPQTHAMWHTIAGDLARHFAVFIPDLPGYGQSGLPPLTDDHAPYAKRSMAAAMVALMRHFGHETFALAGHDRGGRVAYRLALDHPEVVTRIAVLDILPTYDYWRRMDRAFALKVYHWAFLAQPAPFPENLIAAAPAMYLDHTLASWTAALDLSAFAAPALQHYHAAFAQPERIAATCEDYRAGATIDLDHDTADVTAGRRITAPLLALWGETGIAQSGDTPLDVWRRWAETVEGRGIAGGHFLPEENPEQVLHSLVDFFNRSGILPDSTNSA